MARTKISEFSATPGNNTDIDGINIAEGCAPSGINDAIRELMAQLKDFQAGTAGDSFNGPVGTTTAAAGAFTTLTTSGAVTHNGGTANGVAYLNGSKVLTTGSALTFDGTTFKAAKAGTPYIYAENTANAQAAAFVAKNTAGSSYLGQDSTGGYIGTDYAAPFLFYINNSEQMRLTSTGLGIGTSSPSYKLDVSATGTTVSSAFRSDQSQMWMMLKDSGTTLGAVRLGSESGSLIAYANGNQLTYNSSGNLGLGVTPSAWASTHKALQMNWSAFSTDAGNGETSVSTNAFASAASTWNYRSTAPASRYTQDYYGKHIWFTAPSGTAGNAISFTQAMTLDASGRLGLGVTAPTLSFEVGQNTAKGYLHSGIGVFSMGSSTSHPITLDVAGAEKARIDTSGNLLVGTTSAEINSGVGIKLKNDSAKRLAIVSSESANAGGESLTMYSTGAGAFRFYVGWGGTVYATSTSISAISDQTLKENIRDLETGLTEVMALRPRRFDWKNGDAQDVAGFVAQEVEQVLPELVTDYVYNKDEEGNDIIKKSLKMGDILPTLVKAIQEQQAIITDLRARVAALEAA